MSYENWKQGSTVLNIVKGKVAILWLYCQPGHCHAQVLLGPEMGSRAVHFDALRREVQLAARFNSERLVQVDLDRLSCPLKDCRMSPQRACHRAGLMRRPSNAAPHADHVQTYWWAPDHSPPQ